MTTIILTLLLLFPVVGFANTDVAEAPASTPSVATAQQNGMRDGEANKSSIPTIPEGNQDSATDVKVDTQSAVRAAANSAGGNEDGLRLAGNFNPEMPPANANIVARADSQFRLANAEARIFAPSAYTSNLFIVAVTPVNVAPHRFFDRANLIGIAIHAAVRTADAAQTCASINAGAHEAWLPMKGCPAIAGYSLSMVPAQIGSSYLMHRRGHHKLEKLMPYLWAVPSAVAIGVSARAW
jgi:hypothetical protein